MRINRPGVPIRKPQAHVKMPALRMGQRHRNNHQRQGKPCPQGLSSTLGQQHSHEFSPRCTTRPQSRSLSPQGACSGVLRGIGKQKFGAILNAVSYYGMGLPLAVVLLFVARIGVIGTNPWGGKLCTPKILSSWMDVAPPALPTACYDPCLALQGTLGQTGMVPITARSPKSHWGKAFLLGSPIPMPLLTSVMSPLGLPGGGARLTPVCPRQGCGSACWSASPCSAPASSSTSPAWTGGRLPRR